MRSIFYNVCAMRRSAEQLNCIKFARISYVKGSQSTMASKEMRTYDPKNTTTLWELYERAAKGKYGRNITVLKVPFTEDKVNNIDFDIIVADKEKEPREVTRTIVDINMKEYTNHGKEYEDETMVRVSKGSSTVKGNRYHFSTTKGVDFGVGANFGATVMNVAQAGVSAHFNMSKSTTEGTEVSDQKGFTFSYVQEEKIKIPPGKSANVKITTYSMKYEMNYTLKFSVKKTASIPVRYRTGWQQMFCGLCNSSGFVNIHDMITSLPNYNGDDEDNTASFTQDGTLSWIGEGCKVDKMEEDGTVSM